MIVPAVDDAVFHGPGQRRAGIIAGSARIGKAAQDVLRLRRVCNAREAGIAVEDDRQILTADGLRGAERVRAAAGAGARTQDALDTLTDALTDADYLTDADNTLLVTVEGASAARAQKLGKAVYDAAQASAQQRQFSAAVLC